MTIVAPGKIADMVIRSPLLDYPLVLDPNLWDYMLCLKLVRANDLMIQLHNATNKFLQPDYAKHGLITKDGKLS